MALETVSNVWDLVTTNPTSGDPKAQGDDHLRNLKVALIATFPVDAAYYPLISGTAASASGTSIDFTSIPSWVKRITVSFSSLSTNGSSPVLVQIGDSGGVEASGYLGANTITANADTAVGVNATTGFLLVGSVSTATISHGVATLTLLNTSNGWCFSVAGGFSNVATAFSGGGSKSLSATLDRVRITTVNGTDTFDSGTVNVLYE